VYECLSEECADVVLLSLSVPRSWKARHAQAHRLMRVRIFLIMTFDIVSARRGKWRRVSM
jgi:hypothetical protein